MLQVCISSSLMIVAQAGSGGRVRTAVAVFDSVRQWKNSCWERSWLHGKLVGDNGAHTSGAQDTVHEDGRAKWLLHSGAGGDRKVNVGGHDGVRVLEITRVSTVGHGGGGAGLSDSLSFDVALANDGEWQKTVAHLQAGSSHDEALEALIHELGGDDGHADGRHFRVGCQEVATNAARHCGDGRSFGAVGELASNAGLRHFANFKM
jgi:hypothetical protein